MSKNKFRFRVLALTAFACITAAFVGSTLTSANPSRQPARESASQAALSDAGYAIALPDDPEATYQGARIVHNVTVNGQKGMRIHANFTVKDGLDVPCRLIAYFYYDDADSTPLKSGNAKYRDAKGNVSASIGFKPAYDPAVYKDYQLFVPYGALNMESGEEYDLKFYLALYDNEGERFFGKSGWYKFHLTMP